MFVEVPNTNLDQLLMEHQVLKPVHEQLYQHLAMRELFGDYLTMIEEHLKTLVYDCYQDA